MRCQKVAWVEGLWGLECVKKTICTPKIHPNLRKYFKTDYLGAIFGFFLIVIMEYVAVFVTKLKTDKISKKQNLNLFNDIIFKE